MTDYLRDLLAKLPEPIREAMSAAGFDDGLKEAVLEAFDGWRHKLDR